MRLPALNESAGLRYFTFFYLYIMQGIPSGFALTAMANYLTGKNMSPQAVGTFIAIVGIPWIIQFIWGPVIDRYQYSVIGHRKHWVVLTQLVAMLVSLSLLLVHDPVSQLTLMSALFFIHSNFASIQDASVDAIAISVVPSEERGRVNAFMRGGYLTGVAMGAAGLSYVLHAYGFDAAVICQSTLLLIFTVLTFFIKLDKNDPLLPTFGHHKKPEIAEGENPSLKELFRQLYKGMTLPVSLRNFGIIAAVYFCFSVFIRSYTWHVIHVLKWNDQSVSLLQGSWGSLMTFAVIIGGGVISDKMGHQRLQKIVMWTVGIFLLLLNSMYFLWSHHIITGTGLVLWNFADPLFSVASFPILMALCLDKVEGSQFTAYMALINFCDVIGSYVTGWTLNITEAPVLGFTCGVIIVVLVIILQKKPKEKEVVMAL